MQMPALSIETAQLFIVYAKYSEEFARVNDSERMHMRLIIKEYVYFCGYWKWSPLDEFAFTPSLMAFIRQCFSR